VERDPLFFNQFGEFDIFSICIRNAFRQFFLGIFNEPLLLPQVAGLSINRILPLVKSAFPFKEFFTNFLEFVLMFFFYVDRLLFGKEFGFSGFVVGFKFGSLDNFFCLFKGIGTVQLIKKPNEKVRRNDRNCRNYNKHNRLR
jgi:hypothetical protein